MNRDSYLRSEQALLNEYKGNLFEYLVANELALKFNVLEDYILGISDEYRTMFAIQERFIRARFPNLLLDLPKLAQLMAEKIQLSITDTNVKKVYLIGKSNNSYQVGNELASADIMIEGGLKTPVSLKLSKHNAFVNTRSGGIKSFIQKYFPFGGSVEYQQKFNGQLEEAYGQMAFALHEIQGIDYDLSFDNWIAAGHSELPGSLNEEGSIVLHALYNKLARYLQEYLYKLFSEDSKKFISSLQSLMGMGSEDMIQAICFYKNQNDHYELSRLYVGKNTSEEEGMAQNIVFDKTHTNTASFEINMPNKTLQIRIKPMNKFTSMAFKINCSVKYL